MTYTDKYLKNLSSVSQAAADSALETIREVAPVHIHNYSPKNHITGLLLGEVQSGKTGQMFGLVTAAADAGIDLFVVLTSCINTLQKQTLERALQHLDGFNICDEGDEVRFKQRAMREPAIVILKKNARVLRKWKDILADPKYAKGRSLFIVDDEADTASLNTLVNRDEQSAINQLLEELKGAFTGSFYLQVTATPQSLLLQTSLSGWKPEFVHCFRPGAGYLGGSFFYSKPQPYTNVTTPDDELPLLIDSDQIPEGLRRAICTFLVTAAEVFKNGRRDVCNFLIHPSVRIDDHRRIVGKLNAYLEAVGRELRSGGATGDLLELVWRDMQSSKPDIMPLRDVHAWLNSGVLDEVKVITMNSGPEGDSVASHDRGLNIIVGGNTLGRGVTFKSLHTVYYCRAAKRPQADTFWQHSRMFGYDRDPALMRVFMPLGLYNLFAEINNSNEVLFEEIRNGKLADLHIMLPPGLRPTRTNVIPADTLAVLVGGVNYFPPDPDQENGDLLDALLSKYDDSTPYHQISLHEARDVIAAAEGSSGGWLFSSIRSAMDAMLTERLPSSGARLIVRRNRDIGRATGTLLSPDDRRIGQETGVETVLTLYRLTGNPDKGWAGKSFWIPNIKLPDQKVFFKSE